MLKPRIRPQHPATFARSVVADGEHCRVVTLEIPGARFGRDGRLAAVEERRPAAAVVAYLGTQVDRERRVKALRREEIMETVTVVIADIGEISVGPRADVSRPLRLRHRRMKDVGIE